MADALCVTDSRCFLSVHRLTRLLADVTNTVDDDELGPCIVLRYADAKK